MQFGSYELGQRIARGGMAEVFEAEHFGPEGFVKRLAIKRILPQFCEDPEFVQLFRREANLAVELHHANIVQIHDFDHVDGIYYIAMELVLGRDLRRILKAAAAEEETFGLDLALRVGAEALKALGAAHGFCDEGGEALGIIHRDVSPHNILVSYAGEVKLTDFGIAKAVAGEDTNSDAIRGKVPYMAPEQIRGLHLDQRSDLYALGVTLFELLTGRRLFGHAGRGDLLMEVMEARVPDLMPLVPGLSPAVRDWLLRLLAKRPEDRFTTAREALAALKATGELSDASEELADFMRRLFPAEAESARRRRTTLSGEAIVAPAQEVTPSASLTTDDVTPVVAQGRWRLIVTGAAVFLLAVAVAVLVAEWVGGGARRSGSKQPRAAAAAAAASPDPRRRATPIRGGLRVESTPSGALVELNGLPTGQRTPTKLGVPPGRHRVRLRWPDGRERLGEARVGSRGPAAIHLRAPTMRRRQRARIGGKPAPTAPSAPSAPKGRVAKANPAAPRTKPPGRRRSLSRVTFTCRPWAMVRFRGRRLGQTPQELKLPPGRYQVRFDNAGLALSRGRHFRVGPGGKPQQVRCRFGPRRTP